MKLLHLNFKPISNRILFITFLLIGIISCKKDASDIAANSGDKTECIPISKYNEDGFGYSYDIDFENYVGAPYFNPNNDNEFLYLKKHPPLYELLDLYTYNLLTQKSTLIYTGDIWSAPQWGTNDWILFSQSDKNIYKIKGSGDSLTKLWDVADFYYPMWNAESDRFSVFTEKSIHYSLLFNLKGDLLDTIHYGLPNNSSFEHPYLAVSNNFNMLSFFNLENNSIEHQYDYSQFIDDSELNSSTSGSIFWVNNSEVIYSNGNGLNRLMIPSLENYIFKSTCNAKLYLSGSINSSKTKMIWSRADYSLLNKETLKFKSRIYIMNVDGSEEQEIVFR